MVVVIAISTLLLLLAASFALPVLQASRRIDTEEKIKTISRALSEYAVRNNRLPCPALPQSGNTSISFGAELGSGANGDTVPATCGVDATKWEGIVPFATLGLPQSIAQDGWGNYFTYAISPIFGIDSTSLNPASPDPIYVHAQCRTREWFAQMGTDYLDVSPKNVEKAFFCCGYAGSYPASTNISVRNESGAIVTPQRTPAAIAAPIVADVKSLYNQAANKTVPDDQKAALPAFILISHGRNGLGAYNVNSGTRENMPSGPEGENTNDDRVYRDARITEEAGNHYDDITSWMTQDMLMTNMGESCVFP